MKTFYDVHASFFFRFFFRYQNSNVGVRLISITTYAKLHYIVNKLYFVLIFFFIFWCSVFLRQCQCDREVNRFENRLEIRILEENKNTPRLDSRLKYFGVVIRSGETHFLWGVSFSILTAVRGVSCDLGWPNVPYFTGLSHFPDKSYTGRI